MTVGRPRKMSLEETLEVALELFWRRGFEGTSIGELSRALGVGPSSLYNTFGSKNELYCACLDAYTRREGEFVRRCLEKPHAVEALSALLESAAQRFTRPDLPRGCAVLTAPRPDRVENADVEALLRGLRSETLTLITARVGRGVDDGDLAPDTDEASLARYVFGVMQALSAQARDGADEEDLAAVVAIALRALERA
ncbi:MAG: TetR/AcrR family transcriptional regulator [Sandaracinaceae bacterium]